MDRQATATPFRRIALMGRQRTTEIVDTLLSLKHYLKNRAISRIESIVLEEKTAELLNAEDRDVPVIARDQLAKHADLLIVVGGDGSLLQAARIASKQHLPVLGINRGRLGFLTDIHPDQLESIDRVIAGEYQEEERFMLEAQAFHKDEGSITEGNALNDIVLLRGNVIRLIEFDIYIDKQFVCHQYADGLIVATPTGSTAYALSGGGPILHPKLSALVLVPMFPHKLSSRPIVVKDSSKIEVIISEHNKTSCGISFDGQECVTIPNGGRVTLRKQDKPLRLIHPINYTYFDTLRQKLHWEKKPQR